jgi:hypothetical protein
MEIRTGRGRSIMQDGNETFGRKDSRLGTKMDVGKGRKTSEHWRMRCSFIQLSLEQEGKEQGPLKTDRLATPKRR